MPRILDNSEEPLAAALYDTLEHAVAFDACVGYLNLRGWSILAPAVDAIPERDDRPPARILVGMAARPEAIMRARWLIE